MAGHQDWETPWSLFRPLDAEFSFTIDAAALAHNAKCQRWFGPDAGQGRDDGLACRWEGERVFCNPPWRDCRPWVRKATVATLEEGCIVAVLVLPASTCASWWHDYVLGGEKAPGASEIRYLRGRVDYTRPGFTKRPGGSGPRQATAIAVWWGASRAGITARAWGQGRLIG